MRRQARQFELVVVANRLPVESDGAAGWRPSLGGVATAVAAALREPDVLSNREAVWIGWSGHGSAATTDAREEPAGAPGLALDEVRITAGEVTGHYEGCSNEAFWPLYHGELVAPLYRESDFHSYRQINERFARRVADLAAPGATVWVHDYQLQLAPRMIRELRPDVAIGFFLHTPFPSASLFATLPWRSEVLEGLLGADLVGFQTDISAQNFLESASTFLGLEPEGDRVVVAEPAHSRTVLVGGFPVGIAVREFAELAADAGTVARAAEIREELGSPDLVLLGVDRLDYTKGIDVRMRAVVELLEEGLLDPATTAYVQVCPSSRVALEQYRLLGDTLERLAVEAAGRGGAGSLRLVRESVGRAELAALYVAADVMLVTPLSDGMNLVCKEYVSCRADNSGALVLSEHAGAAIQMPDAWIVDPFAVEDVKRGILAALNAPAVEARRRMAALHQGVVEHDVRKWATDFLSRLGGESSESIPSDLSAWLHTLPAAVPLLVCCDFDGTLAPIVSRPAEARMLPGLDSLLQRLALLPNTHVAVMSGRALDDLARLSGLVEPVALVGSHGGEFRWSSGANPTDGPRPAISAQEASLLAEVDAALSSIVGTVAGVELERKALSLAVHVRRAARPDADHVVSAVREGPARWHGVHPTEGKEVLELAVREVSKGAALTRIRASLEPGTRLLYLGDDVTDESAFATLVTGDAGVKVGEGLTCAEFRVGSTTVVREVLTLVASARGSTVSERPAGSPPDSTTPS